MCLILKKKRNFKINCELFIYLKWFILGKNPTDEYLDAMMNEAPGPLNFTMFLTLFGERLQGTDPEEVIKNAFGCFDEENTGFINEDRLRELLITMGDRFTDEDVSINVYQMKYLKQIFFFSVFTKEKNLFNRWILAT